MKLLHLSDLHLGKRVNGFSMIADQRYILDRILEIVGQESPDAVLIAGDIYDKSVPTEEAVELFDRFLNGLTDLGPTVFVIAGNHDSAERLAFGGKLFGRSGVHFSPVYRGIVEPVILEDDYGSVAIWLLPFVKPVHIRRYWPESDPKSVDQAVRYAISKLDRNPQIRNVLVAHQFVTGSSRCDSEELSVGGTDGVGVDAFEGFDYVALGHLHGPQSAGLPAVRYAGSPLKYSFSEARQKKSVTVVELGAKQDVTVRQVLLIPQRDLAELKGSYDELTERSFYEQTGHQLDYIRITLTDQEDVPNAAARLRVIYPYLMKLDYENRGAGGSIEASDENEAEKLSPMELFSAFFEKQNDRAMNREQIRYLEHLFEQIWEDGQ